VNDEQRQAILQALWPEGEKSKRSVWAVLDCARDAKIYLALLESKLEFRCLYSGQVPPVLVMNAPHLVELSLGNRLVHRWLDEAWGSAWGVLLKIDDASNLRHHLRKFLRVRDSPRRQSLFRFYDPRVLRVFLPSCDLAQSRAFFGPIATWMCESRDGQSLLQVQRLAGVDSGASTSSPFTLRGPQIKAFEDAMFRTWLERHLRQYFADACSAFSAAGLQALVDQGIEQACGHGFVAPADISRFVHVVLLFGADFERDPELAWAREVLADPAITSPAVRMDLLHDRAVDRLREAKAPAS